MDAASSPGARRCSGTRSSDLAGTRTSTGPSTSAGACGRTGPPSSRSRRHSTRGGTDTGSVARSGAGSSVGSTRPSGAVSSPGSGSGTGADHGVGEARDGGQFNAVQHAAQAAGAPEGTGLKARDFLDALYSWCPAEMELFCEEFALEVARHEREAFGGATSAEPRTPPTSAWLASGPDSPRNSSSSYRRTYLPP